MASTGWSREEAERFLRFQYRLQQTQYQHHYPNASFGIIYIGNRRAGCLHVNRSTDEIRIIDIAFLPEFRGRGIGTYILNSIIAEADSAGLPVRLHVAQDNPAMSLYNRLGFIRTGDEGAYYSLEHPLRAAVSGEKTKKYNKFIRRG